MKTFLFQLSQIKKSDWSLFFLVFLLVMIGFIMIFSTMSVVGLSKFNDGFYFVKKQLIFLLIGFAALVTGLVIPHQIYKKYAMYLFFSGILLLILTLVPALGVKAGGAQRWIDFGFVLFQPIELVKFFIAVFLATAIANKQSEMSSLIQGLFPILGLSLVPVILLLLQPDLGNSVLIFMVILSLLFLANVKLKYFLSLFFSLTGIVGLSIFLNPYQLIRIQSFLNPWSDPLGKNYHVIQSFTAIGSGGLMGLGFGQSKLKFFYLPLHYSDFIFAIICEEGGLVLAGLVLVLFGGLLVRAIKNGIACKNLFSFYLSLSLSLFLVFQALINMAVAVGVFPVTGIPLTFISYGGTSLVCSLFFVGVLLNISQYTDVSLEGSK